MLRALREIEGAIQLSRNVAARLPHLRKPPILESFLRQVYFIGVTASTGVVMRACGLGVIIIAVMMNMLDADVDPAVKILLRLVFLEIDPLAAAGGGAPMPGPAALPERARQIGRGRC